jgi:hypothetical protein
MRGRLSVCLLAAVAGLLAAATAAPAGTPGHWTDFTSGNLQNFAEPGIARTADGVLHVVWHRPVSRRAP